MTALILSFFVYQASALTVRVATDASTLDWNRASDAPSALFLEQIMRGLFKVTTDNHVEPDLASSITVKARTATIKVRAGEKWSDGRAVLAQDFVDSYLRLRDPKTGSPVANFLESIADMKAIDAATLTVTLKEPIAYLPALLSHPCLFPIRRDLIDKFGNAWVDPKNLVVIGPYKITSRKVDSLTHFEPLSGGEPVDVRVIENDGTAQDLFEAGQLDIVLGVSPAAARQAKNLVATRVNRVIGIMINPKKVTAAARAKIAAAVDRDAITKALGLGRVATANWVSPDLLAAKSKLDVVKPVATAAAGPSLIFASRDDNKMTAEILQQQLHLKELQPYDFKSYVQKLKSQDFELALFGWNAGFPDAVNFLDVFTTGGYAKFANDKYDAAVAKAKAGDARAIKEAQEIIVSREHVMIPLYQDVQLALVQPKIKGYELANGYLKFDKLRKSY